MREYVIYRNMDPRNRVVGRWDLMRLDEMMVEPNCPYPPCDHATAQEALNCLIVNNGITHFQLEVVPQ